jgi:hypothetical protein
VVSLLVFTGITAASSSDFVAPPSPSAGWLETMNYYRIASGLLPVTENPTLTSGVLNHVTYLAKTNPALISGQYLSRHSENPASPYATKAGITSGAGDLTTGSTSTESEPIDGWMAAPFHAVGIMRENLRTSGFGQAFNANSGDYEQGLSVLSGLVTAKRTKDILFPGPNSKVRLNAFTGENPDPRESCGSDWQNYLGLPIWTSLISTPPRNVNATLTTPSGALLSSKADICVVDEWNFKTSDFIYGPAGKSMIASDNLVLIIPKKPLDGGNYQVKLSLPGRGDLAWSFSVIPPLPAQITLNFPTKAEPNVFTWHAVAGSTDDTVLSYEVILTNPKGKQPQTFTVSGTSFDDSSLDPGDYSICVRALGSTSNSSCAWYSITKGPRLGAGGVVNLSPTVLTENLLDNNGAVLSGTVNNPATFTWTLSGASPTDPRTRVLSVDVHLRLAGDSKDLKTASLPGDQLSFAIPRLDSGNYSICVVAKNNYGESSCNALSTFRILQKQNQVLHFSYSSRSGTATSGSSVTVASMSSVPSSGIPYTPDVCSVSIVGGQINLYGKKAGTCSIQFTNPGDTAYLPIDKKISLKFH